MVWTEKDQDFEREWWGTCANTFGEENKQITYAYRMGLVNAPIGEHWPAYDLGGMSIVDIGGGPVSILLKCRNMRRGVVVDPCPYPEWTRGRYTQLGIELRQMNAEDFVLGEVPRFDEAWIYNCLQHTIDPQKIVANARAAAKIVRLFEWVECGTSLGHPHELHAVELDKWLGGRGTIERMAENGCNGTAYYGVFSGL